MLHQLSERVNFLSSYVCASVYWRARQRPLCWLETALKWQILIGALSQPILFARWADVTFYVVYIFRKGPKMENLRDGERWSHLKEGQLIVKPEKWIVGRSLDMNVTDGIAHTEIKEFGRLWDLGELLRSKDSKWKLKLSHPRSKIYKM